MHALSIKYSMSTGEGKPDFENLSAEKDKYFIFSINNNKCFS